MSSNFYDVLGLPKDTTQAEIKAAFRKLSLQWHPVRRSPLRQRISFCSVPTRLALPAGQEHGPFR